MAAAVTAPLPGLTLQVGKPFVVTGTGFANTTAFSVGISKLGVTVLGTTSGGGALTTAGLVTLTPQDDTPIDLVVSDGTSTINVHCEVATE